MNLADGEGAVEDLDFIYNTIPGARYGGTKNVCVRTSKYLNNLIEQDHRRMKQQVYPMLGFNRFGNAAITISGIELAHKIKKGQFDLSGLGV